jgi:ubiquinol-cytochrome c reductase iron-sulfur subunit
VSDDKVDTGRRHFLTVATTVTGVVGAAAAAAPFILSLKPSARTQALGAPVEVDISKLEGGARMIVEWRGKPVWVIRRTPEMIKSLSKIDNELRDPGSDESIQPAYAKNESRALNAEYLVLIGVCTHLGCSPEFRPVPEADLNTGGFLCACHGSKFDLSGRVYKGVPAPTNLPVPAYRFIGPTNILIGDDTGAAA